MLSDNTGILVNGSRLGIFVYILVVIGGHACGIYSMFLWSLGSQADRYRVYGKSMIN